MQSLNKRCSICLKREELTDEHIFPRGLVVPGTRQIRELLPIIDPQKRYRRSTKLSQNGLKVKTTCAECNNTLLGAKYDPALKHLYDEASLHFRNRHMLSGRFKIANIEINKVARAVVGHMLAADSHPSGRALKTREMRRFLFDETHSLANEYSILIWLYPSREQAIIRDIFPLDSFSAWKTTWMSAYKTFPLAFAFTQKKEKWPYKGIIDITDFLTKSVEDKVNITFSLNDIPHQRWPETPSSRGAIFMGDGERLLTKPHIPNKKYPY